MPRKTQKRTHTPAMMWPGMAKPDAAASANLSTHFGVCVYISVPYGCLVVFGVFVFALRRATLYAQCLRRFTRHVVVVVVFVAAAASQRHQRANSPQNDSDVT